MPPSDVVIGKTINDQIREFLEDPEHASGVLQELTAFFRSLDDGDLLNICGVPVWDLLRRELIQILEPELYRLFLVRAVIKHAGPREILLNNEHPTLSRAVRLCAKAEGLPVRIATHAPPSNRFPDERVRLPLRTYRRMARRNACSAIYGLLNESLAAGRKTILISTEWMSNTEILRSLMEMLAANPTLSVHFLSRSSRHNTSGIPFERVWHLRDVLALGSEQPSRLHCEITRALRTITETQAWRRLFRHHDLNLEPLVRHKLRAVFSRERLSAVVRQSMALRLFFDRLRPDLIVDSDGIMLTSVATDWAAASLGLRRLKILHYDEQLFRVWALLSAKYWDHVAVMGSAPRAAIVDLGVDEQKVHATGYPFFDKRLDAVRKLTTTCPSTSKRVLYTAQGLPEESEVLLRVIEAFEKLPDYELIARAHPLRPHSLDRVLARCRLPNIRRAPQKKLYDLIADCSLVMTISSITAFEAVLIGRPVLVLEPRPGHPHNPSLFYTRLGVGRQLFDLGRIAEAIRSLCEDETTKRSFTEGQRRTMNQYFDNGPGDRETATKRLESCILGLASTGAS